MADILYENYITGDDANRGFYDTLFTWNAQTFTPSVRHTLNFVKVKLLRSASSVPGVVTATIRSTAAGVPTSTVLKTGTFDASAVTTSSPGEFVTIYFLGGVIVDAGTVYALALKSSTDDNTKPINWRFDATGSYGDGAAYDSDDQGATWSSIGAGRDFMFEEWGISAALPVVTTQAPTNILATTATGNGYISDLGGSAVTQHGHVWATTVDPDTSDNKTTLGATSLGPFTSSLTGLIERVKYYIRAYATNTDGTSYGQGFSWFSGLPATVKKRGNLQVVQERLHYIGESGQEYTVQGIVV